MGNFFSNLLRRFNEARARRARLRLSREVESSIAELVRLKRSNGNYFLPCWWMNAGYRRLELSPDEGSSTLRVVDLDYDGSVTGDRSIVSLEGDELVRAAGALVEWLVLERRVEKTLSKMRAPEMERASRLLSWARRS